MVDEVLFEIRRVGTVVRVSAIDPKTGTEAIIMGPAAVSDLELRRQALNKLRYVLEKRNKNPGG